MRTDVLRQAAEPSIPFAGFVVGFSECGPDGAFRPSVFLRSVKRAARRVSSFLIYWQYSLVPRRSSSSLFPLRISSRAAYLLLSPFAGFGTGTTRDGDPPRFGDAEDASRDLLTGFTWPAFGVSELAFCGVATLETRDLPHGAWAVESAAL